LGPAKCFHDLKAFLTEAGYTERSVCERLGLGAQHELLARKSPRSLDQIRDSLDLLIKLFLLGECVEESVLQEALPSVVLDAIGELELLSSEASRPSLRFALVLLYPIRHLHIVSDRWTNPDGAHFTPPDDIVYPALTKNTYRFLSMLPPEPCQRLLDLGSGTGVAALVAADYADHAWAVDITERSTRLAEFNRLLNGVENVTVLQGDLYEPVRPMAFDRIVAHPPYVPAVTPKVVFQDAGSEGEEITRGIVCGLPAHLSPGGKLYCLALGADRQGDPFERRIRGWLDEHESAFDVFLGVVETHTPEQIASQPLLRGEIGYQEFKARKEAFEKAGIERFVYGLIVVQRVPDAERPPFTARRQLGPRTGSAEFEWALRWETVAASPAFLLQARPVISKNLELRVVHRVEQGTLAPAEYTLLTDYPFSMECQVHVWTAALTEVCDGSRTGFEIYEHCRQNDWISPDVAAQDFARFLGSLISGGFLEVEGALSIQHLRPR